VKLFQEKIEENSTPHFLLFTPPPPPPPTENCAFFEIMWKNIVESDRPQVVI